MDTYILKGWTKDVADKLFIRSGKIQVYVCQEQLPNIKTYRIRSLHLIHQREFHFKPRIINQVTAPFCIYGGNVS